MRRSGTIKLALLLTAGVVAFALCAPAHADVRIVQTMISSGMGCFLDSETKTETMIKGDRQCVNTELRSKLFGMFGGDNKPVQTTAITCLDKGLVWDVMHDTKSYTETPITQMRDMMDAFEKMGDEGDDEGFNEDEMKMSPPKFSVEKTGKKETIAGYACEQSILTMEMEGVKVETGDSIKIFLTMDMMLAEDVPGFEEQQAFYTRYAEAAGLDEASEMMSAQSVLAAMADYGVDPEVIAEETGKLQGVPLRVAVTMRGEGPLYATPDDDEGGSGEEPDDERAQEMLKQLGGLFGGGKEAESGEMDATDAIFTFTTEIIEISTASIPDGQFEPPAGYDKIAADVEGPE
jgi:hypothetical protein